MDRKINSFLQTFQTNLLQNIHANPKLRNILPTISIIDRLQHVLLPLRISDAFIKTLFDETLSSVTTNKTKNMLMSPFVPYLAKLDNKMQNMNIPQYYGGLRNTNAIKDNFKHKMHQAITNNLPEKYKVGLFSFLKQKYLQLKNYFKRLSIEDRILKRLSQNQNLKDLFSEDALDQWNRKMEGFDIVSIWNVDSYFDDFFSIEFEMQSAKGENRACLIKIDPLDMRIVSFECK